MMRTRRLLFVAGVLAGVVGFNESPSTQSPAAAFHAIGDLPGGGFTTIIWDATRAGGAIAALTMTQELIQCDTNAPVDDVEPTPVTGGTSLRYDEAGGYFVQNWRVPNTPGRCYMVRMTTTQDALALTVRFQVR